MKTTQQNLLQWSQKRKKLFVLPILLVPFFLISFFVWKKFHRHAAIPLDTKATVMGFDISLPGAVFPKEADKMNKMDYLKKAAEDSAKRKEAIRRDMYLGDLSLLPKQKKVDSIVIKPRHPIRKVPMESADELLEKLETLQRSLQEPAPMTRRSRAPEPGTAMPVLPVVPARDTVTGDAELTGLNDMLKELKHLIKPDPVVSIPEKNEPAGTGTISGISAVVQGNQRLVNGATIMLRLLDAISINGVRVARGQLVYGQVQINNDRMTVSIRSVRLGRSILFTDLQVYDMDGLPGIRIPDLLSRQVARQSADQGIGSLNLGTYNSSLGAQAVNAGIQTGRSFFSRKIRLVQVTAPAGYQVLLRDMKGMAIRVLPEDSVIATAPLVDPPSEDSMLIFMNKSVREGGMHLELQGIYAREGLLWLRLSCDNRSGIDYLPDYIQCSIRGGRKMRRMAVQQVPVETVFRQFDAVIPSHETGKILVAIPALALSHGQQLQVEIGERSGSRELVLEMGQRILSKARNL